jgi:hypothetical protein
VNLEKAIAEQNIVKTTTFSLDSNNQGHVTNIPFIAERAKTSRVNCDLWLETVKNSDGSTTQQLQYSQVVNIDFSKKGGGVGGLITWPHVSVNTLTKLSD